MNIILKKDGQLSVNDSPIQGKAAAMDNLAAMISNPSDGDAIVYDATAGLWKAAKLSTLPAVTGDDDIGQVLCLGVVAAGIGHSGHLGEHIFANIGDKGRNSAHSIASIMDL